MTWILDRLVPLLFALAFVAGAVTFIDMWRCTSIVNDLCPRSLIGQPVKDLLDPVQAEGMDIEWHTEDDRTFVVARKKSIAFFYAVCIADVDEQRVITGIVQPNR